MSRKNITSIIVTFLLLGSAFINASEWTISRKHTELTRDEFQELDKENLIWKFIPEHSSSGNKYAMLNGKVILALHKVFTTTTGGIYLKILSAIETEDSIAVTVEYPHTFSCSVVNKQMGRISLYSSIENPQSKKLEIKWKAKDICKKDEL
ncbi:MAG: hypothetical protein MI749_16795 [Desulfovibrionales bacterium]|nr:hypothetical protein [Desulfovibrionales bacterium]